MKRSLSKPEAAPVPNGSRPIWDLVIEDMRERDRTGRAKYGTPLQADNGRDALVDAYQEALDLTVYLRQAIEERKVVLGNYPPEYWAQLQAMQDRDDRMRAKREAQGRGESA